MGGVVSGIGQTIGNVANLIPQQPVQTKPIIDPRDPNMGGKRDGRNPVNTLPWTPMSNRDYRRFTSTGAVPGVASQTPTFPIGPSQISTPFTLPSGYQSPYANYGFDPGLQSYLDQQMYRSYTDGGVGFQYDPTNQTFTGATMSGTYNPIPLNVMQQAAGGNRDVLNPYFQSRFPIAQPTPQNYVPEPPSPYYTGVSQPGSLNLIGNPTQNNWQGTGHAAPMPTRPPVIQPGPNVFPQPRPQDSKRGLGGLQLDKFRSRIR